VIKRSRIQTDYRFELAANRLHREIPYGPEQEAVLDEKGFQRAAGIIRSWPGYETTPLIGLGPAAEAAGVSGVHYKDESGRFGLGSFKPLGGAYAVLRQLMAEITAAEGLERVEPDDVLQGRYSDIAAGVTVTAATDGNHGRSVAWGARLFGCRCVIFIHETVSPGRERAIAALGAEVRRTPGSYDDAVRVADETARREGWHQIPDTSDGVLTEAPRNVMQGYTLMAQEAMDQLPYAGPPTHIFVQAGVGGMAAAVAARFWQRFGPGGFKTILVEPRQAACWYHSLKAGKPVAVTEGLDSLMAGLACGEVSRLAWTILAPVTDAMITIEDAAAADCMRLMAAGRLSGKPMVAGESAVAGLAGFLAAASDDSARAALGIEPDSRVLLFGTEGASDPETYAAIVGRSAEEIERSDRSGNAG
jgi:diaminopropionate ammonia-lyase